MQFALHSASGKQVSYDVYANIRQSADIIARKLIDYLSKKTPSGSIPHTKTFIRGKFPVEYRQALFDLEKEQTILRLCCAHWKADSMITQAFLRLSNAENKAARGSTRAPSSKPNPSDGKSNTSWASMPSHAVPTTHDPDVAPTNTAKRAFVMSPGPKSPSVSHSQKRTKDDAKLSAQKTTDSLAPLSNSKCSICQVPTLLTCTYLRTEPRRPPVPRMVASFLSRTEDVPTETACTILRPIYVDPSGASM